MDFKTKIIIFMIMAAGLFWLSRRPLCAVRSHGFYRFFAWIGLLALVLVNIDYWFVEPFSSRQVVSWIFLLISLIIVIWGTVSLKKGKAGGQRNDALLIGIEKTTELITAGAYRYIRHPMYSSFLFGAWGICIKHYSWLSLMFTCMTTLFAIVTAKREEIENVRYFGNAYRDYIKQTRMFIPFIF